jgi:hypothetical protein
MYICKALLTLDIYTTTGRTKAGDRVLCQADIGKEEQIFRYPEHDSDGLVKLFQLSITTHIEGHPVHGLSNAHLYLDRHFQTCDVGVASVSTGGRLSDSKNTSDRTIFGGRIRPLQINVASIQQWLGLCDAEHGKSCQSLLSNKSIFR